MPADEYAAFSGGGTLKLKGAKVKKHKKKKEKSSDLERNLSAAESSSTALEKRQDDEGEGSKTQDGEEEDSVPTVYKTEAEQRLAEAKQKKVQIPPLLVFGSD